jgi:NAD(P) transhydrogenase subunit alpha
VKSIGGEYLAVEIGEKMQSSDGYAKETSAAYNKRAAEIYTEQAQDVDIIITTALIPGKPAPKLLTAKDVSLMKPGSVIVDMAAAQGGNVEGSAPGKRIVTKNGVIILGYTDLPARLPQQSSQLYGTNLVNLLKLLTPNKDGKTVIDFEDVVQRSVTVVKAGEITWPPPPVQVSAAPAAATKEPVVIKEKKKMSVRTRGVLTGLGLAALFGLISVSPPPLPQHFLVLTLAIVVGFYVIGKVHHALHTPLMSVTNAISGIVVVAAILQITDAYLGIQILAAIGVLLASINVFGGFAVTRRMLKMFTKGESR